MFLTHPPLGLLRRGRIIVPWFNVPPPLSRAASPSSIGRSPRLCVDGTAMTSPQGKWQEEFSNFEPQLPTPNSELRTPNSQLLSFETSNSKLPMRILEKKQFRHSSCL